MTTGQLPRDMSITVADLAQRLGGTVQGDGDLLIRGTNTLDRAGDSDVTFVTSDAYARRIGDTGAGVLIATEGIAVPLDDAAGRTIIVVANAEQAMIDVLELFAPPSPRPEIGVHATAVIDADATIGADVCIGAHVWVGPGATIGDAAIIHAGARVYPEAGIGEECVLHSNVVIRERCQIGRRCTLHSGVIIGTEGFGYRPSADGRTLRRMPHIGTVEIGDEVEIGANSCVDRGKFGPTRIGDQVKIDNLVQIGHNVTIGAMTVIASQTGVSGSVTIGRGVQIGGQVGMTEHLTIGDGAQIGAGSGLMQDVAPGQRVLGAPANDSRKTLRSWAAVRKLGER